MNGQHTGYRTTAKISAAPNTPPNAETVNAAAERAAAFALLAIG